MRRSLLVLLFVLCASPSWAQLLSPAQRATLKTAITNDVTANALYENGDLSGLAAYYNAPASPTFYVYRRDVPIDDIRDQINWTNLTPADAPDGTQAWLNRATQAQAKQFNLQIILSSASGYLNAAKSSIRAGLQDALTALYTGTNGASQSAGWTNVRDNALARVASRLEKLFATGNGGTPAQAGTMAVEGPIAYTEFQGL